ncbi:hypothetical protein FRB96_002520, partial [Tulasnella sp. 330]
MPSDPTNKASRSKSVQPTGSPPPPSPQRASTRGPTTPAAIPKSNPLDLKAPSLTTSKKEEPVVPAGQDKGSQSQRLGVTRSASASATTSASARAAAAEAEAKAKKEKEKVEPPIDMATFEQILELDEDDPDRPFTKSIVENYYEQVDTTFTEMEEALTAQDLSALSSKGHFLKGSSAALGVTKVQATCEAMQHNGQLKDDDGSG